jgi:hypothetical protein
MLYPRRLMDEKEPTQQTQPKKGEPITIPVPKRDDIDKALVAITQPVPAKKKKRHKRKRG